MPAVILPSLKKTIQCPVGSRLMDVLLDAGVFVDNPCNGNGTCGKCRVRVLAGEVSPMTEGEAAHLTAAQRQEGVRLSCMTRVLGDVTAELCSREGAYAAMTDGLLPEFEKDPPRAGCGVAVDIGTTTVAVTLVDFTEGRALASTARVNPQKRFGLDVLTRITYEYDNPETGFAALQQVLVAALNEMIEELCAAAGRSTRDVREIAVAANCTMTHMLLGIDARGLGRAPYTPAFTAAQTLATADIGLLPGSGAQLYCLPQVSAYIGGDIVAGAYVCDLANRQGNHLFIDIGTNGELVLASDGRLLCCSCAAGPALEGANILCGMRAETGAVEDMTLQGNDVRLQVIGGGAATGLCGSGILAAVRELLQSGLLRPTGAFVKAPPAGVTRLGEVEGRRAFLLQQTPPLWITQQDVRQVQLAKGAILSGFTALLRRAGLEPAALDGVLVAGQFGAHLPAQSLAGVGIVPPQVQDRITYVGNSAKTGAQMALLSQKARRDMEALAQRMEYLELAETADYQQLLMECMRFPAPQQS